MKTPEKSAYLKGNMFILFIDTSSALTRVSLYDEKFSLKANDEWESSFNQSEELLTHIDQLLLGIGAKKDQLRQINVIIGPGSYTGVRVGVTTANFLAFSLNLPVCGIKKGEPFLIKSEADYFQNPVMPYYEREPFITKPKARLG